MNLFEIVLNFAHEFAQRFYDFIYVDEDDDDSEDEENEND